MTTIDKNGVVHYDSSFPEIEKGFVKDEKIDYSSHPSSGFQIGGYYSYMFFITEGSSPNCCLEWVIRSNGEFPTDDDNEDEMIKFHICDFRQIERFVAFWGKVFREKGIIVDE